MKKVFLNVWKKALVLSLAAITFVITACGEDSGLGSTVDTEAPKIEITYPPLGANIRGTFVLAGNCDDDKSVKSIIVTVTDTTTKKVVGTVPASIENEGKSWKASINNYNDKDKKYDYLDGNYQFTAEVHDGAGHKSNASRVFDLDNTAPVFVASNPGVIKSQGKKASAYGSIFTIDGTIADDHTIASLTAKIFDENGTLIGDYREEDIATAGGTSVTIASHYVDKNDGTARTVQNERYTQIYGDNDAAGTKKYYCTVLVEDNTKSYTNSGESDNTTSGNITSKVYLYDSVYKSLMSSKSGNRYGLSAADFMTLLNGTRAADEKTEPALKILKEVVVDTGLEAESDKDANKLSFSLNPMANPTYSVNGFAVSKDAAGNAVYKEAFSDSTVVVSVNAGLDKTAILPGNLKVWTVLVDGLSPEDAQKRVNLVANKVTALQKIHSTVDEVHERADEIIDGAIKYADKEFGDGSLALVKDNSDDTGASVQTETLSCVLPKDTYISGKVYAFVVTGYDEDDVAFLQNTLYAFKANEAGIAPTLIITEPANQSYIKTTEGLVFKGKTYLPDGSTLKVSSLKINLHVMDENDQNKAVGNEDGYTIALTYDEATGYSSTDESLTYDPSTKIWTFTPSKMAEYKTDKLNVDEGKGSSYFYTLDISSESSSGNATAKTLSVHIDATLPKITITNVTTYVLGTDFYSESGENTRNYVNGDISIKYNIEETNLKEASYRVLVDGEEKVASTSLPRVPSSGSIKVDTTKWSASATEKKELEVIITAVDTCGNTTSYSTTDYNIVTYPDENGDDVPLYDTPFIICQETDIPQIEISDTSVANFKVSNDEATNKAVKERIENGKNLFKSESKLEISLSDDDGLASARVMIYNENGEKVVKKEEKKNFNTSSYPSWKIDLPKDEGVYQVEVEVIDTKLPDDPQILSIVKDWRKNNTGRFFIAIDNGAPEAKIITPTENSYQETTFAANGTISEKDEYTKLTRYIRKRTAVDKEGKDVFEDRGTGSSITINVAEIDNADGSKSISRTWNDSLENLDEGVYRLEYEAQDRYKQASTAAVKITVDKTPPVFDDSKSSVGGVAGAAAVSADSKWFNNETLSFQGELNENTGIESIYYWLLDKEVSVNASTGKVDLSTATKSFAAKNESGAKWSYTESIPDFTECDEKHPHILTLVAVDKAGNQSERLEYSIKVDMTPPTFENYYYKMGAVKGEVSGNILTNGENDVTLYGLISDGASGVDVSKFVLNVVNGTTKSILADTQTVKNITFTTELAENVGTTEGFEKWIEKADKAGESTFGEAPADATKITGWKAVISKDSFKTGDVRTNYFDKAGNGNNNYKMFSIRVDKELPKLSNPSLKDETPGYSASQTDDFEVTTGTGAEAKTTKLPHYYVNNGSGHTFALEGIATDNEGISKVELLDSTGVIKTSEKGQFKWTGISLSSLDADKNITIKITDIANNVFEQKIHITPDTTAPEGKHSTGNVDNYFRIGDASNGGVSDVGVGQSAETYGKDSTLKIRGYFTETGSGLSMIYYKLFSAIPTEADIEDFKNDYEGKKGGYFSPLDAEETRTIGTEEIKTNFKTSIPGFKEGKNYLVLIAVDKVGNYALDTCSITNETSTLNGCYEIKVDMTQPRFERFYYKMGAISAEVKGDILTNGENNVTLYGLISDEDSGVDADKLKFYIPGTTKTVIADSSNITFTTESTSWSEGSVASTDGLAKWVEKADKDGESTFKAASSISDATKITGWKAVIAKEKFQTGEVRADYYDKAGNNSQNIKMFSVRVDTTPPKLNNHTFADATPNYTAYKSKTVIEGSGDNAKSIPYYYICNKADHKFTLSGVATDNEGISKVELKNGTDVLKTAGKGDFNFDDLNFSSLSAETELTLQITDIANNVSDYKIVLTPDVKAPTGSHHPDSEGKDKEFRVGEQEYKGEKVGAKYSSKTYGNSNSIMIRGLFDDETGSGLSMIYYKLSQSIPTDDEFTGETGFVKNYKDKATGYFAPTAKTTQTISVNTDTGKQKQDEDVDYNFKTLLSGFQEGNNYLVLVAVDNVGNAAVDTKTFTYTPEGGSETTVNCYSINVDTAIPELSDEVTVEIDGSSDGLSANQILTNFEKGDITLSGSCSDAAAGIDSVALYVEGKGKNSTGAEVLIDKNTSVTVNGAAVKSSVEAGLEDSSPAGTKTWTGKVSESLFSEKGIYSGTFAVYATVKDKAGEGNTVNRSVATIIVDKEAPTVELKTPADADSTTAGVVEINGIIDLSGEIGDGNILPDKAITAIQYVEKPATDPEDLNTLGWVEAGKETDDAKKMADFKATGNYTFSAKNFDTSKLTDKTVYYLRAVAVDKAGNIGYSAPVTVKVYQDTDRPIIKITSLDKTGDIISAGTIMGTISDDDGIKTLEYSEDSGSSWTTVPVNSGSWRIDGLDAGSRAISFRVTEVDKTGTVFETGKSTGQFAADGQPYVVYGKNELDRENYKNKSAVAFKVDLNDPKITLLRFASTDTDAIPEYSENSVSWQPTGKVSYGPAAKYMSIYFTVEEDVEMADSGSDVEIKAPKGIISLGDPADTGYKVTRTLPTESTPYYVYKIGVIDTSDETTGGFQTLVSEGNNTITVTVTDKSGRKSSETFNIFVDNAAPTVKSFYNDTATGITGKVTIPGSVTDSTGIKTVKYIIPTATQQAMAETALIDATGLTWVNIPLESSMYAEFDIKFTSSSFTKDDGTSLIYYAAKESATAGKLEYAVTRSGTVGAYTYAQATADTNGKYPAELFIPVFFYTEDINGSKGITKFYYKVNPDGGIPKVELTSHAETTNGTTVTLVKTGNKVNLMGTAEDDEGVTSVKITKLEYTTVDGDKITDSTEWKEINISTLSSDSADSDRAVTRGTVENGTIVCDGTTSWKASINTAKINTGTDELKAIRVTVEAFDENDTSSSKTHADGTAETCINRIVVDKTVPVLESAAIVGFNETPASVDATPVFEKSYEPGMYFSGKKASNWYLKAVITDDSSVTGFEIASMTGSGYIRAIDDGGVDSGDSTMTAITGLVSAGQDTKTYTVLIPINAENEGHVYATLEMLDGQHTDVTTAFSFFIDNTPPALYEISTETDGKKVEKTNEKLNHASTLRLKSNGLQVDAENNVVENSDGSYTFGDELVEARSGLSYVAFYFKKAANATFSTKNRVYSPMFGKDDGDNVVEVVDTKEDGKVYINSENLPALYKSVTIANSTTDGVTTSTVTFTGLGNNKFINNAKWLPTGATDVSYGIVKIGGAYHKITKIEGDFATLGDEVSSTYTEAEFIYAMLVDHQIAEGFAASESTGVSNDDGDGLVEMVKQTGSTYKWTASILSDNIPDGPAEIHIVAFDEAGNSNSGYVKTSIQNNRPRIARVYLATDLNGNGKFDFYNENGTSPVVSLDPDKATENGTEYGELVYYSTLTKDGKVQGNATLSEKTCKFVASGDTLVLPEIIGGNGTLQYAYSVGEKDEAASKVGITQTSATVSLSAVSDNPTTLNLKDRGSTTDSVTNITSFLTGVTTIDKTNLTLADSSTAAANKSSGHYAGFVIPRDDLEDKETWVGDTKQFRYFAFTFWDETPETTQGTDSLYALLKIPMIVNVIDDVKPKADITPFYWNSREVGSFVYAEDGTPEGHIDILKGDDSKDTTKNPGVSGTVWLEGTAYDETRLSAIKVQLPGETAACTVASYENGEWITAADTSAASTTGWSWPTKNGSNLILSSSVKTITEPSQKGHKVAWKVKVNMTPFGIATGQTVDVFAVDDSAQKVAGVVKKNESDGSETQTTLATDGLTPHYVMNFVPYIKSIYPASAGSAVRSRLGKFPVQAGKDMVIEGMNFAKGASYTVTFKNTEGTPDTALANWSGKIATNGQITVTAPQYSRWVEVTVGGQTTQNNSNDNGGYNIEAGYVAGEVDTDDTPTNGLLAANRAGTNFWTDDRYISVWNSGESFVKSPNPISGTLTGLTATSGVWSSAGEKHTFTEHTLYGIWGANDNMMYNEVFGPTGQYLNERWYRLATKASGDFRSPPSETDSVIVNNTVFHTFLDDGWADAETFGQGLQLVRDGETAAPSSSSIELTKDDKVRHQFQNIKIAGAYKGEKYHMYVTYYDAYTKCLKYGKFIFKKDWDNNRSIETKYCADNAGSYVIDGYDADNNSAISWDVGEFSAIKIDNRGTEPIPVVAYYDKKNKVMKIARGSSSAPVSKRYGGSIGTDADATPWTYTLVARPSGCSDFGRYVAMEMDNSGNLHIAAQDVTNGKLYYGMFTLNEAKMQYVISGSWQAVDATSSVGRWNDIKLENPAGTTMATCRPVITYQNASKLNTTSAVKIAYVDDNGNWEAITSPSVFEAQDSKVSGVVTAIDKTGKTNRYAIGINSTEFAVDFMRGEE